MMDSATDAQALNSMSATELEQTNLHLAELLSTLKQGLSMSEMRPILLEIEAVLAQYPGDRQISFSFYVDPGGDFAQDDLDTWVQAIVRYNERVQACHEKNAARYLLVTDAQPAFGENTAHLVLPANRVPEGALLGSGMREAMLSGAVRDFLTIHNNGRLTITPDGYRGFQPTGMQYGILTIPFSDTNRMWNSEIATLQILE